jgi:putative DNA methylase
VSQSPSARKLAQALGAHLEGLSAPGGVIKLKGSAARLVPVSERRGILLGPQTARSRPDGTLFDDAPFQGLSRTEPAETSLDRLHQAMLLFADGRTEGLRRFLGEVADERFRRLTRALSALYPAASSEKRWIDGVLGAMRVG